MNYKYYYAEVELLIPHYSFFSVRRVIREDLSTTPWRLAQARCSSKTEAEERLASYLDQNEFEVIKTHISEFEGATGYWDKSQD
jgi:acetyl-CoA carboxylase beta subunit